MNFSSEVDVHKELSGAAISPTHKILGVLITLITMFDGYDTFNPAYVIHYVMQPWSLVPSQAGLLVSSGLVGFLFGAIGHGMVADRVGRRGTLLVGLWIVNIFTLLTAILARDFGSFCAFRFITGLGLGVLLPLGTTFINEVAPHRVSNTFSLWGVTLGWSLGGVFAGLVGVFLTPLYGWQILYYVGASSILLTLVVHAVLPESPKFLAARNRTDELRTLLARHGAGFCAGAPARAPPESGKQHLHQEKYDEDSFVDYWSHPQIAVLHPIRTHVDSAYR